MFYYNKGSQSYKVCKSTYDVLVKIISRLVLSLKLPPQRNIFFYKEKYLIKDIELTVNADVVLTVDSPSMKPVFIIIYNSGDGKYYLWR